MTLGQKLKALLKDNHMTQEDLAERLEVSRQAVGKWVNDKGIPEVGKLVQISNLFGVSLDYLLKEDYTESVSAENISAESVSAENVSTERSASEEKAISEEKAVSDSGYYVSQEMLDGYLSYNRQNIAQITGGVSLIVLSDVFDCLGQHNRILSLLYLLTIITGIVLILWHFFQVKQYQEIKKERLTFDDKVYETFQKQREGRRRKYAVLMIVGVILLFVSSESEYVFMVFYDQMVSNAFEGVANAVGLALVIGAGLSMRADSIVIENTERVQG